MLGRWLRKFNPKASGKAANPCFQILSGDDAEDFAAQYLLKKSFDILERNYSIPSGEIDIVASTGGVVVFIEIKYLSSKHGQYFPEEQVTVTKQKKIIRAAESYLQKHPKFEQFRFDVIAIQEKVGEANYELTHYEDAFESVE